MKLTVIVLTLNEEVHLARCLDSVKPIADEVIVVDSFSNDRTIAIAEGAGARVLQHAFVTQAAQFNWALDQLGPDTEWILRIDADEYLTPALQDSIRAFLAAGGGGMDGAFCKRRMTFQGKLIRHGGVFPVRILRLFRHGRGRSENRWMDEHIKVPGRTVTLDGELIDDNLGSLTWWTDKHNKYASREVVDLLNLEYRFMAHDSIAGAGDRTGIKRWIKESVYARLPGGARAFAYFFYRYVLRLGFLDGQAGTHFHFLQGFWYRYLVDAKVAEVKRHMREKGVDAVTAIHSVLGIRIF